MKPRRSLLLALLVVLLALHVFHALVQGDGGWWQVHGGIVGAIVAFFVLSLRDPVLSAGLSDFMVVLLVVGVWMFVDLPPAERRRPRTYLWLLSYLLFPGLGVLLYFLWLRPDHRLVAGPRSDSSAGMPTVGSPAIVPEVSSLVTAFSERQGLDDEAARLTGAGYHVVSLDAGDWYGASDMHDALAAALRFPDHYGRNLDALNDCLRDIAAALPDGPGLTAGPAGVALVLRDFDRFARADRDTAQALLDIVAAQSDHRLRCLVQTADPTLV